jgi:hypothetical protein
MQSCITNYETLKLLKESIGEILEDRVIGNTFLNRTIAQEMMEDLTNQIAQERKQLLESRDKL